MSEITKDTWKLGEHEFSSRFILGSGKYSLELIDAAVKEAKAEIVTMALRRANEGGVANILDYIPKNVTLLPNTSGARNAEEAVRIARLSRQISGSDFVKIEVIHDSKYLLPDNYETAKAVEVLAKEGFVVMPYMYPDLNAARDMQNAGAACIMPLAAPIANVDGIPYMDGGLADSIPIEHALEKGNDKIVVVLTRNPGYRKKRALKATEQLYKRAYKKYPNLVRAIMTRNAVYNRQMKLIEKLEEEGKIFVIRPLIPTVSRMEKDYDKLQHFYMHGNRLMKKEYQGLLEYLNE
mgnify:FL=1